MSKVNITFDTLNESCILTVDGEVLNDIVSIQIYNYDGKPSICIEQYQKSSNDGDLSRCVRLVASESEESKSAAIQQKTVGSYKDFTKIDIGKTKAQYDLGEYLKARLTNVSRR